MYAESPGNIRNQIGRSLNLIRENVEQEDPWGLANHVRLLVALSSPHLTDEERKGLRIVREPRDEGELFESCMGVLERLLPILARKGLYAFLTSDPSDASDMALTDEDSATAEVPIGT